MKTENQSLLLTRCLFQYYFSFLTF